MKVILVCWSYLILWYLRFNQELGKCYWVFASSWELASVGLRSKESQRNGIFGVLPARKMVREPKRGMRGRGRRSKETLADKPLDFEDLSFPPPPPSFVFGSRPPIFRAGKTPKIPFFGLSLLPHPTETPARLASWQHLPPLSRYHNQKTSLLMTVFTYLIAAGSNYHTKFLPCLDKILYSTSSKSLALTWCKVMFYKAKNNFPLYTKNWNVSAIFIKSSSLKI